MIIANHLNQTISLFLTELNTEPRASLSKCPAPHSKAQKVSLVHTILSL